MIENLYCIAYFQITRDIQIHRIWDDINLPTKFQVSDGKEEGFIKQQGDSLTDTEYLLIKYDFRKQSFFLTKDLKEELNIDELNKNYLNRQEGELKNTLEYYDIDFESDEHEINKMESLISLKKYIQKVRSSVIQE